MEYVAQEKIRNEMSVKEGLVWCGRPKQGIMLRPSDAYLIPFYLLWTGFAGLRILGRELFILWIWGIPFVAVGLYLLLGRFFVDAMQRSRTYYGVTTERIIIVSGFINRRVKSLAIGTLGNVSLTEKPNKRGTITFGPIGPWYRQLSYIRWPGLPEPTPSFEAIPNAKKVYEKIRSIQDE